MFYIIVDDNGDKYLHDFESISYNETKVEASLLLKANIEKTNFFAKIVRLDSTAVLSVEVLYSKAD